MSAFKYTGIERRHFIRIPFWFVTKYRLYPHNIKTSEVFRQGIGKNISTGGICFEAHDKFENGSNLEIEIDMPSLEHSATVVGKIVWISESDESNRFIYGVEFSKINTEDLISVKKIIETFA
jgi:Tfp pilus assembly protein PilZ